MKSPPQNLKKKLTGLYPLFGTRTFGRVTLVPTKTTTYQEGFLRMSSRKTDTSKPEPDRPSISKERKCLMCSRDFTSQHVGERVCSNCKSTAAWREGGYFAA